LSEAERCPRCGDRWLLHGGGPFADRFCIAWDGARFCACPVARPARSALELLARPVADLVATADVIVCTRGARR